MNRFEIVLINSLGCQLGSFPVAADEHGEPLTLAAFQDEELRGVLADLQPGDRLHFEQYRDA